MKRLSVQGFLFLCILGLIVFFLEYLYKDYNTITDNVYSRLAKDSKQITHVYIGNSHTINMGTYTTDSNAHVLNIGFQGLDLFKEQAILNKWIPQLPQLKYVYIGIDYEVLGQNQSLQGEDYLDRQFYKYTDTLYKYNFSNILMAHSNFFRANRDLSYLFKKQIKASSDNYIPLESKKGNLSDAACKKRAKEHSEIKFRVDLIDENIAYLNTIIQTCKKYNIHLIIFNTPKSSCFKSYSNKNNLSLAKHKVDSITTYTNTHYYDYYNSPLFTDAMFKDYDHLQISAAQELLLYINKQRDSMQFHK